MSDEIQQQAIELSQQFPQQFPVQRSYGLQPEHIALIQALAPAWHQCRWFGLNSPEQAVVLMAKAADLGLPVTAAFDFFDIIENKPALKPIGALALIHRSRLVDIEIDDSQDDRCTVTMTRRDTGFSHTVVYTVADAMAAGLIREDKPNSAWNRYRKDQLRNRAVGRCSKIVASDIIGGLYLTIELEHEPIIEVQQ